MSTLTDQMLSQIMPNAPQKVRAAALPILNAVAAAYSITTEKRICAWLATLAVESGELRYQQEIASGAAYEGRKDLGNTQPGDGKRFKGRGRIQITGRFNYQAYTTYLKQNQHLPFIDFIQHPEQMANEPYATDTAGWFFAIKINANPLADKGNFLQIQIKVNGRNKKTGLPNHWDVRNAYYKKALAVIPASFQLVAPVSNVADAVTPETPQTPVTPQAPATPQTPVVPETPASPAAPAERLLKLGHRGDDVKAVQQKLVDLKLLGPKGADGIYGPLTKKAVIAFQKSKKLGADGIVGPLTRKALFG